MNSLEKKLGYQFSNKALHEESLRHRSYTKGATGHKGLFSNERLEFLGDRVLGLVMAEWLFQTYPNENEGELGARHAQLVSGNTLAEIALKIGLADFLKVDPREAKTILKTSSVLADAMEAQLGAIFLDSNLDRARDTIKTLWKDVFSKVGAPPKGNKSELQEYTLKLTKKLPVYSSLGRTGPDHAPLFKIEVSACGHSAEGTGTSKKLAEDAAANELMMVLRAAKKNTRKSNKGN